MISCLNEKDKTIGGSEYKYSKDDTLGITCTDKVPFSLIFNITHENFNSNELSKYKMILKLHGVIVYDGLYKQRVEVSKICKSNIANMFNVLVIYLIKDEKMYVFHKKDSFKLRQGLSIDVQLLSKRDKYGNQYRW